MLTDSQITEFHERGFVRVADAFGRDRAAAMEERLWAVLENKYGARRSEPDTWNVDFVSGLQGLRGDGVFEAIGSANTQAVLDELVGRGKWQKPKHWGQFLVSFPNGVAAWTVPHRLWHTDYGFHEPPEVVFGALVFSFLSHVPEKAGGTLAITGSHRLLREFLATQSREAILKTKMKEMRHLFLQSDPWLQALTSPEDRSERIARFMETEHAIGKVPVRVVELTGAPGDLVVCHPWLVHAAASNCGDRPRLMRVQRIRLLA